MKPLDVALLVGATAANPSTRSWRAPWPPSRPRTCAWFKPGLVDGSGAVTDESTRAFLHTYLARFGDLVRKLAAG